MLIDYLIQAQIVGLSKFLAGNVSNQVDQGKGYAYRYDQLNRLTGMKGYDLNRDSASSPTHSPIDYSTFNPDYREHTTYDANGNIQTYWRQGYAPNANGIRMDSLFYNYYPHTNRLKTVRDSIPAANYSVDIDDQDTLNYSYDQIGNLTRDDAEELTIDWTVYGKVKQVRKDNGT